MTPAVKALEKIIIKLEVWQMKHRKSVHPAHINRAGEIKDRLMRLMDDIENDDMLAGLTPETGA